MFTNTQAGVNNYNGLYNKLPGSVGSFGGGGGQQNQSNSSQQSSGGTYWQDPNKVNSLAGSLMQPIQAANAQYMNFISNPAQHPIFQNALSGLFAALLPSEMMGRMNLNDQFRAAGNTASSTYGDSAANYESNVVRDRQAAASNLPTTLFPQVAQAMQAPMSMTSPLIEALKLSQQQSSGSSQSGPAEEDRFGGHSFGLQRASGSSVYRPRR